MLTLAEPRAVAPSAPLLALYKITQRPRSSLANVDKATMMARISCKQVRMKQEQTHTCATDQGCDLIVIPLCQLLHDVLAGRTIKKEPAPITEKNASKSGRGACGVQEKPAQC